MTHEANMHCIYSKGSCNTDMYNRDFHLVRKMLMTKMMPELRSKV